MRKIYNSIAFAYKAGKLILGTDSVVARIKSKDIKLVIVTAGASFNTTKLIQEKAEYYGIDFIVLNDYKDNFGKIFRGKAVKVIGIEDENFNKLIRKNL